MAARRRDREERILHNPNLFTSLGYAHNEIMSPAIANQRASETQSREGMATHLEAEANMGSDGEGQVAPDLQQPEETRAMQ